MLWAPPAVQAMFSTTLTTTPIRCPPFREACGGCLAAGCNYCEVSPYAWRNPRYISEDDAEQFRNSLDYVCIERPCNELPYMRQSVVHNRPVPIDECATVTFPSRSTTTTTTPATTQAPADPNDFADISASGPLEEDPDKWPNTWGPLHWILISAPPLVLFTTVFVIGMRWWKRSLKFERRVHVAETPAKAMKGRQGFMAGTHVWDFTQAGRLHPQDIENAARALIQANEAEAQDAKLRGRPPAHPRLALSTENELQTSHLDVLTSLVQRHQNVLLSLDTDWAYANDAALLSLATLLKKSRQRLTFEASAAAGRRGAKEPANEGGLPLRLPRNVKPATLCAVGEALALTHHPEVEELCLVTGSKLSGAVESISVSLGAMRLSPQELTLSRQPVGDAGCAAACGFVRPWCGRLQICRMLECELGDPGAAAVAHLMNSAPGMRELVLSANRIGDRGITEVAEALPSCDGLERLLIDRNFIGAPGAKALAQRLPRSGVKELVLGSHLGGNPLGPAGVEALAAALDDELPRAAANREFRLGALALEACQVGEAGAKALAATLPKSALFALSVARGDVGTDGAQAILRGLPPSLMSLDLAGNSLGDVTAQLVGEMLYQMPQTAISLAQNLVSPHLRGLLSEEHGTRLRV